MASRQNKSSTRNLQKKTEQNAWRIGQKWDDDEVSYLFTAIEKDKTTFEMAMHLGRSYYGTSGARSHVAFASRHPEVFVKGLTGRKKR